MMMTKLFFAFALSTLGVITAQNDLPEALFPDFFAENNRCINATELEFGVTVNGTNDFSEFDFLNQAVCGQRSDRNGVWYEVAGNGQKFTAYACSLNKVIVNYGIFNVCNGNTDNCVGFPDASTDELKDCELDEYSTVSWNTERGQSYYIHVRADGYVEFELTVTKPGISGPAGAGSSLTMGFAAIVVSFMIMFWM